MYKEVLRAIEGISIYPIISLTLFFIIFSFLIFKVIRYDKNLVKHMADMPLDDGNNELSQKN